MKAINAYQQIKERKITMKTIKNISPLEIAAWHQKTFPDTGLEGQIAKLEEEKKEWEASKDLMELADIYIVACGLTRYSSAYSMMAFHFVEEECMLNAIFHKDLLEAVDKKMGINYNRVWKATKEGSYHHI